MRDLSAATAFITGAGKGIGCGIARALAARGARLALADLDADSLGAATAELGPTTTVRTFAFDVRDRDAFGRAVDEAESQLGPVNILCNNAGLVFPEDLEAMTYEVWDLALGVNLGGVVNGVQTVLPRMMERGNPAHVVNTASVAGLGPGGGLMYTTGKYAVVGLSESLGERLSAKGLPIGVTVLCPGAVATDIAETGRAAVGGLSQDSGAARDYADRLTESTAELLATHGVDPDTVGRRVAEAITTDARFVLTDRAAEGKINERTQRILASMPPDASEGTDETIYQSAASLREK
ncbi:SDR family oxidoreductase [Halostreptopolyspora alba]|uniref:SDR family NAD(P)-dependent oxidoreductase n=1 Tax=Halostreptopolyspora alba TaxID=2487137 RepID=A0A3N0DRE6_9ACTN|nr:SDR family NAD(P)-dependent oxidoreductase [Nocardiopsaceae bacterium YIM 96095]